MAPARGLFSNQITMKLFFGHLALESTKNDLQVLFEQHGQLKEVALVTGRMTVTAGDRVRLQMSPCGTEKARIVYGVG